MIMPRLEIRSLASEWVKRSLASEWAFFGTKGIVLGYRFRIKILPEQNRARVGAILVSVQYQRRKDRRDRRAAQQLSSKTAASG